MSRILKIERGDGRIIVISDIHGGLHLVKKLLKRIQLKSEDHLIILGDFLQRGYDNEATLAYMKVLLQRKKTYVLSGNHEHYLCSLMEDEHLDRLDYHMNEIHYGCIIREWIRTSKIGYQNFTDLQNHLKVIYAEELKFLSDLPYAVEIEDYIFVHGGIKDTLESSSTWDLLSTPEFLNKTHQYHGTVVVGHWPVQNYKANSLSGDVIFNEKKRIISIDGCYGVKSSGQINALIIDQDISVMSEDDLNPIRLLKTVKVSNSNIVKLDFYDRDFELIKKGKEFSTVIKKSTQEVFELINEYLEGDFEDYITTFVQGEKDSIGKLIRTVGNYALVKLNGEVGWINKSYITDI